MVTVLISFDSTYEGLKRWLCTAGAAPIKCFDSTYEGLKHSMMWSAFE